MMPSKLSNTASQFTDAPQQAVYVLFLEAAVEHVFANISSHDMICDLVPGIQNVSIQETEGGTIRCCDFGNDMLLQERIVLWEPPNYFGYQAEVPNPFGLWKHLALVSCQANGSGTTLQWRHYFEHDDLQAMTAMLDDMFATIWQKLLERFGGCSLPVESLASIRPA
jgi:hypothetical protein